MKTVVDVDEAQTQFDQLVELVERGEEVVLTRDGRPVARLIPYRDTRGPRPLGSAAGKIEILPGFDEYDEEIIAMFEGSDDDHDPLREGMTAASPDHGRDSSSAQWNSPGVGIGNREHDSGDQERT